MILFAAGLINMLKVPITAMLNSISAWWHMVGVLVFVAVLVIVPDTHNRQVRLRRDPEQRDSPG